MTIDKLLLSLIDREPNELKKCVLYTLLKHSELIEFCNKDHTGDCLPLFLIENERYSLIYQDKNISEFEDIFTDYEEILIILQMIVSDNRTIYFYCDSDDWYLSPEELLQQINEAIKADDPITFAHLASQYRNLKIK